MWAGHTEGQRPPAGKGEWNSLQGFTMLFINIGHIFNCSQGLNFSVALYIVFKILQLRPASVLCTIFDLATNTHTIISIAMKYLCVCGPCFQEVHTSRLRTTVNNIMEAPTNLTSQSPLLILVCCHLYYIIDGSW